jgi:hypothetical protein
MKTLVAAGVGAVIASGLVYMMMKPDRPAEPAAQTPQTEPAAQPAPPAAAPPAETPAVGSAPVAKAAVPPPTRRSKEAARKTRPESSPPATVAQNIPQQPAATTPTPTPSTPEPPPSTPVVEPKPVVEEKKPVRVPQTVTIPAGTLLSIRVDQTLSTKTNQTGDSFRATLDQPVVVDGFVIAERGARVEGRIVESDPGGRVKGVANLSLELVRLNSADGQRLRLQTEPFAKQAQQEKKRDAMKVGAAAGLGAAIGAIAGGGKGAAIGAGVGGAAGAGGVAATRGAPAEIPAETRMTFRLRDGITVTEKLP